MSDDAAPKDLPADTPKDPFAGRPDPRPHLGGGSYILDDATGEVRLAPTADDPAPGAKPKKELRK